MFVSAGLSDFSLYVLFVCVLVLDTFKGTTIEIIYSTDVNYTIIEL